MAHHPMAALFGVERLAKWSGLKDLWQIYRDIPTASQDFARYMLSGLGINWTITYGNIASIPESGSLLVVANHPTGGVEGLIAETMLNERRSDLLVFGNHMTNHIPELSQRLISVGSAGDARRAMVTAIRHLQAGGAILMFPAGTVAHWQRKRGFSEAPWHSSAERLALLTHTRVQPLQFKAKTTWRWQVLSAISRSARTALLPHELLAQRGQTVQVHIGPTLTDPVEIKAYFHNYY